jgi:formylglycine-generating enzyme
MKKYGNLGLVLILILILVLALSGCGGSNKSSSGYTGVAFTMIAVPSQSYEIAQTEVTYELWNAVYTWALANGYTFANAGAKGSSDSGSEQQPVTTISWDDAMVWCNALTEYYNAKSGTSYACVYTYSDAIVRNATDTTACDGVTTGSTAKGFRLPTSDEWYQAARYIDGTHCYPDTYASGADATYNATTGGSDIDEDSDVQYTSDVAVYDTSSTAAVKSKSPNKLGLYDMSGNVWEWCFDILPVLGNRVLRGGSWFNYDVSYLQLGVGAAGGPSDATYAIGFRPVRTN